MSLLLIISAATFIFTFLTMPLVRQFGVDRGIVDLPDNRRKVHLSPIPRIGGVSMFLSLLLVVVVASAIIANNKGAITFSKLIASACVMPLVLIFLTGLLDDLRSLTPCQKLVGQFLAALLAALTAGHISFTPWTFPGVHILEVLVTVVWLMFCTNALNLLDGLDGLAAGIALFFSILAACWGFQQTNVSLLILALGMIGSLLGFLRYNFASASIFMGDCGSLTIGFCIGYMSILLVDQGRVGVFAAPLVALTVPLLDTCLSIIRRFLRRQPVLKPDRCHLHHRLLSLGFTRLQTVYVLYITSIGSSLFAALILWVGHQGYFVAIWLVLLFVLAGRLKYPELSVLYDMLFKVNLRDHVLSDILVRDLEAASSSGKSPLAVSGCLQQLCHHHFARSSVNLASASLSVDTDGDFFRLEVSFHRTEKIGQLETSSVVSHYIQTFAAINEALDRLRPQAPEESPLIAADKNKSDLPKWKVASA